MYSNDTRPKPRCDAGEIRHGNSEVEAFAAFFDEFSARYGTIKGGYLEGLDEHDLFELLDQRLGQLLAGKLRVMEDIGDLGDSVALRQQAMSIDVEIAALAYVMYKKSFDRCQADRA